TLSGTLSQSGQLMRAEVHGMGSLTGASPAAQLLGAHTRLQLAATLNAAALDLQQLTLSGHALTLAVTGSAQRAAGGSQGLGIRSLQAQWRVSLPNLALISPTIAGSLQTTGSAQGPLNALATDIRARSTLAVRGGPPGNFEASLQAKGLPSTPTGNLHAHGTFDGSPLQLDAAVTRLANAQYRGLQPCRVEELLGARRPDGRQQSRRIARPTAAAYRAPRRSAIPDRSAARRKPGGKNQPGALREPPARAV